MTTDPTEQLRDQIERLESLQQASSDFSGAILDLPVEARYFQGFEVTLAEDPDVEVTASIGFGGLFDGVQISVVNDGQLVDRVQVVQDSVLWRAMGVWLADMREGWLND